MPKWGSTTWRFNAPALKSKTRAAIRKISFCIVLCEINFISYHLYLLPHTFSRCRYPKIWLCGTLHNGQVSAMPYSIFLVLCSGQMSFQSFTCSHDTFGFASSEASKHKAQIMWLYFNVSSWRIRFCVSRVRDECKILKTLKLLRLLTYFLFSHKLTFLFCLSVFQTVVLKNGDKQVISIKWVWRRTFLSWSIDWINLHK